MIWWTWAKKSHVEHSLQFQKLLKLRQKIHMLWGGFNSRKSCFCSEKLKKNHRGEFYRKFAVFDPQKYWTYHWYTVAVCQGNLKTRVFLLNKYSYIILSCTIYSNEKKNTRLAFDSEELKLEVSISFIKQPKADIDS